MKQEGTESGQQYSSTLRQIVELNPSDHQSVSKLAELMHHEAANQVENVEIEKVDPNVVFEKALQQQKVSVPLWE